MNEQLVAVTRRYGWVNYLRVSAYSELMARIDQQDGQPRPKTCSSLTLLLLGQGPALGGGWQIPGQQSQAQAATQ